MNFSRDINDHDIIERKPEFKSVMMATANPLPLGHPRDAVVKRPSNTKQRKSHVWAVTEAMDVPFYPLERPVKIEGEPSVISNRVSECLRTLSVQAEFDSTNAEARCKTDDFVSFTIRLFVGPEQGTTLVEVNRRQGCSLSFGEKRDIILNAAKGIAAATISLKAPKFLEIPDDIRSRYFVPPSTEELKQSLDRFIGQLHSCRRDVQLFALQSLALITDKKKTNHESAHEISRMIMDNEGNRDLFGRILLISPTDNMSEQIINAALSVMVNAMSSLSSEELGSALKEGSNLANLIPHLLHCVEGSNYPHNSCLVLQFLTLLLWKSDDIRSRVDFGELERVLEHAKLDGRASHSNLEREACNAQSTIIDLQNSGLIQCH